MYKKPTNNKFGEALQKIRESQFLTRQMFGNKYGVRWSTIEAYETGTLMPDPTADLFANMKMNAAEIIAQAASLSPESVLSPAAKAALGKSVKILREHAGMSAQKFAGAIKVSTGALLLWEKGEAELSLPKIKAALDFFDCATASELNKKAESIAPRPVVSAQGEMQTKPDRKPPQHKTKTENEEWVERTRRKTASAPPHPTDSINDMLKKWPVAGKPSPGRS